jgi:hypothetical protein
LLVNYNPKLTLTENLLIKEDAIGKAIADIVHDGKVPLSDFAKNYMRELPVVKQTGKSFEDFLLGFGGLEKATKTTFVQQLLKDSNYIKDAVKTDATMVKLINSASESLAKQLAAGGGELGREFKKLKTLPEQKLFLKNKGYRPDVINNVLKDEKLIAKDITKTGESVAKKEALAKETRISKNSEKFKEYYDGGKGRISDLKKKDWVKKGFLKKTGGLGRPIKGVISKRKILAWAAVAGVTYLVMKWWLNKNGVVEKEDEVVKTDDGGGQGGGTTYTNCSSFPYKKGCVSPIIGEVQKCLGLSVDNKFGPQMVSSLSLNNYGTEISEDVYNKIKSKCGSTITITPPKPITPPLTQDQTYGIEPTPQEFEGGTQTIKINADEI